MATIGGGTPTASRDWTVVAAFLESRQIDLAPETRQALGSRKDAYFLEHVKDHGVEPYGAAITLVRALRARKIKTADVSSSNSCKAMVERFD